MKLFLSPHPDDECLFGAYTIMRERPLVVIVTHPTLQGNNGYERLLESYRAMRLLNAPVCFLGIDEHNLNENNLFSKLISLYTENIVYVPELEDGNPQHNLVNLVASDIFPNIRTYKTYTGLEDRSIGREIIPTNEELELKKKTMACYKTQIENRDTKHYFNTTKEYE